MNGLSLWASGPGEILQGGDLNDVFGAQLNDVLIGGAGDNQYYLAGLGNQIVQGPTGINTVTTWMNYALPDNIQNLNVTGDGLYAVGNSLDNLITVGDTNGMTLYGAGGNNVLVGGQGSDVFIIDSTPGTDAIYGWHPGDAIRLTGGSPLQTFAQIKAAMVQQGSDVVVHNGTHDFVIRGATIGQFSASDFQLALDGSRLGALTFDDEFNALSLRNAASPGGTWSASYDYGGLNSYTLTGNGELQIYTAAGFTGTGSVDLGLNPFSLSGGVLDIHAQTVTAAQSAAMWGYGYSSGVITTKPSFAQTYGYFEMRAELPSNNGGAWPAFWLVPADGSWPPELDIVEQLSGTPNLIYTTAHSIASGDATAVGSANYAPNTAGLHTYGVLWTPATLSWYVDGVEVFETATPSDMNRPMYMIANMAVGGWSASPDWSSADMRIDYIRTYALPGQGGVVTTIAPAQPTRLADASVLKGYVNKAHDGASQSVTGLATPGATITVYDGVSTIGAPVTADANGAWSVTIGALADGAHAITAKAANAWGQSPSSLALTFVVDTQAPTPAVKDVVVTGSTGLAAINGVSEPGSVVTLLDGGKAIGSATADAGGLWKVTATLSGSAAHSFTETALDVAGNSGTSAAGVALFAVNANQTLSGGAGADVLVGRNGDTLTGGLGSDQFVFNPSFGKETITDFTPARSGKAADQILFDHTLVADFAHVLADAVQSGTNVIITVDHADILTLRNVSLSSLQSADFGFF